MFAQGVGSDVQNHKCLHRELDQLAQMFSQAGSKEEREKVHSLNIQYFFDDIKSDRKMIQIIVLKRRQKLGTDRQTFWFFEFPSKDFCWVVYEKSLNEKSWEFFQFSSNQGEEIQSNVNKFPVRQFQIKVKTQGETFKKKHTKETC